MNCRPESSLLADPGSPKSGIFIYFFILHRRVGRAGKRLCAGRRALAPVSRVGPSRSRFVKVRRGERWRSLIGGSEELTRAGEPAVSEKPAARMPGCAGWPGPSEGGSHLPIGRWAEGGAEHSTALQRKGRNFSRYSGNNRDL